MNTEEVKKNFENLGKDLIISKKVDERFIIYNSDNNYLINCILEVVAKTEKNVVLKYRDLDNTEKEVIVDLNDGEFYTDSVKLRRQKETAIGNIINLMEYNDIELDYLIEKIKEYELHKS